MTFDAAKEQALAILLVAACAIALAGILHRIVRERAAKREPKPQG